MSRSLNVSETEAANNFQILKDREYSNKQSSLIICSKKCKIICWERLSKLNKSMAVLSAVLILLAIAYLSYSLFIHS